MGSIHTRHTCKEDIRARHKILVQEDHPSLLHRIKRRPFTSNIRTKPLPSCLHKATHTSRNHHQLNLAIRFIRDSTIPNHTAFLRQTCILPSISRKRKQQRSQLRQRRVNRTIRYRRPLWQTSFLENRRVWVSRVNVLRDRPHRFQIRTRCSPCHPRSKFTRIKECRKVTLVIMSVVRTHRMRKQQ